jgi:hypothetical protein
MNSKAEKQEAREECKAKGHEWKDEGTYSKCSRCAKLKRNVQPIKVVRPIAETGEIIEQSLPPGAFKATEEPLVTRDFTAKVLAGDRPGLIFPGDKDCPLENGQEVELTSNVSLVVIRVSKTKGGDHRCRYSVRDFRETLIRRTPKMHEPPERDEYGYPIPHTKEAIAAATVDGNYTQDPRQAVPSTGPEVDVEYRRVLGTRSRTRAAERKRKEEPMQEGEEDIRRLTSEMRELAKRAVKMGVDPATALAPIAGEIKKAHIEIGQDQVAA